MTDKIRPSKRVNRFELYNCTGKLRVEVKVSKENGLEEVILMPKRGGCKTNLQLIGKLITGMCECNIDPHYILEVLDSVDPCTSPKERTDYKEGKIKKEELGFGGCTRIIEKAIKQKLDEIK